MNYGSGEVRQYTFDPMGNRLGKTMNGVAEGYAYNNVDMHLIRGAASYDNDHYGYSLADDLHH